jgi:hypothetical protein
VYAATYSAFKTGFTASRSDYEPIPAKNASTLPDEARGPMPHGGKLPPPEQRWDILGTFAELIRLGSAKSVEVLTAATGGTSYPFARQRSLEAALGRLGQELHGGYVLSFVPEGAGPGFHKIEVRVPKCRDCRVRARPAYWSEGYPE